ncbi:MAG: ABC transporter permease [Planctomycetota bacterium]|jgi:putative ABC transport system permease protein
MRRVRVIRNVRLGVKSLMLHKLRSLLTVLGVVFGVGSVIAMLAVGEGASYAVRQQIRKLGSKIIIIETVKPPEEQQQQGGGRRSFLSVYGLLYEDEVRIHDSIDDVTRSVPAKIIERKGRLHTRVLELRIVGTTPDWFDLVKRDRLAGRLLLPRDGERNASVCVLTEHGARRLLATEHTIGQTIQIGSNHYEVVGIIRSESVSGAIQAPDRNVDAYIPIEVARNQYGDIDIQSTEGARESTKIELHRILVEVPTEAQVEPVAEAIERLLDFHHKRDDYRITVPLTLLRQYEATKRTFNLVLGLIAGISLLVGGIGIMNIMLATVTERTREIGVRRAIGAKRRQIVTQFLIETVVLTTIGGIIGVGAGVGFAASITLWSDMPTIVPLYSIILSLVISVTVGIVFGLYPAIRAARLDPITALRHE